ncbi:MAG TPA: aconitase X [Clostridia bacterium]|nr:aconitase X [Clostridia bacterium]HOM35248.1 aconitase X [Clostridia bacterium]HOR89521.1 aconitase X [Clostridia bacterium]HOT70072.1 aconitase X [Clostridia bacterium]HPL08763.1 aconitase X [Clostridia bacterium]
MFLTDEEKDILNGSKGEVMAKVAKSVVMYGEVFDAKRLVPVTAPSHLVTSFGISLMKAVFAIMDEINDAGVTTIGKFTVDPRPLDYENVKCNLLEKLVFGIIYGKQKDYEEQLKKTGLKDSNAFSCTCYMEEVGNIPKKGDILSWAESSAVVYANSVIGARCNRNSGIIEMFGAILGKVPEFDLLTDEGRKATWIVQIKTTKKPEAQVLGSAIGMKVMSEVPYIKGLDKFIGKELNAQTKDYLKDMGAATASNGAVGLYHVENLTPEAVELKDALIKDKAKVYVIDDAELERVKKNYPVIWKNADAKPSRCFIGCPHLSYNQLIEWTDRIGKELEKQGKKKVSLETVFTAAPDVVAHFKENKEYYDRFISYGTKISSICPLMYMNNPICGKRAVVTNSNKLRTYTTARYYTDEEIAGIAVRGDIAR